MLGYGPEELCFCHTERNRVHHGVKIVENLLSFRLELTQQQARICGFCIFIFRNAFIFPPQTKVVN